MKQKLKGGAWGIHVSTAQHWPYSTLIPPCSRQPAAILQGCALLRVHVYAHANHTTACKRAIISKAWETLEVLNLLRSCQAVVLTIILKSPCYRICHIQFLLCIGSILYYSHRAQAVVKSEYIGLYIDLACIGSLPLFISTHSHALDVALPTPTSCGQLRQQLETLVEEACQTLRCVPGAVFVRARASMRACVCMRCCVLLCASVRCHVLCLCALALTSVLSTMRPPACVWKHPGMHLCVGEAGRLPFHAPVCHCSSQACATTS